MSRTPLPTLWLWLGLFATPAFSQSIVKQADRQFDMLAYSKAADLYEQALQSNTVVSKADVRAARAKLAYSYKQVRDTQAAERVYRELIAEGELPAEYAQCYLYFAQSLASNGKYREAQEAYEKYNSLQKDDPRGTTFSKLYNDVTVLSRNAGNYKIDYLNVNSNKAEFSPTLYKNGLVFVSAQRNDSKVAKRVFNWNNTPFLDLYYMPEEKAVKAVKTASLSGAKPTKQPKPQRAGRALGRDEYTPVTSNDSRTVGNFAMFNENDELGLSDKPLKESGTFSKSLNTKYHEGPATFTKDGSRVIFTRNNYTNGKYRESSDGINKLKLYTSTQTRSGWSEAKEIPFNSDEYSTGHPALGPSRNGEPDQLLYFVSDMPGGFGGTDIYVARWEKDHWGKPINLGKEVNTKGNEIFPFVDEKGNLYFSSEGHAGLGDLDIFYAPMTDDGLKARSVQNLGEPINSNKDDFGIVTDGERKLGYFSSNRRNGGADDDIYRFKREGPLYQCRELTVMVVDAQSKSPLTNAQVAVENADNAGDKRQLKTDAEGNVRLCLDADNEFRFVASNDGYLENKVGFSTRYLEDDQPSRLEIGLEKPKPVEPAKNLLRGRVTTQLDKKPIAGVKVVLRNECDGTTQEATTGEDGSYSFETKPGCDYTLEAMKDNMGTTGGKITKEGVGSPDLVMFKKGDVLTVENIYYDKNKFTIRPDAARELDKLVDLMKKYPAMKIEMRSHTDSRSSVQYNKTLSGNRAKSAVAYLKSKGVKPNRLIAKGYGECILLNKCKDGVNCTEEEHQQNRRTEIKILVLN